MLGGGEHGQLFPAGDFDALADGLGAMLDDPGRRAVLADRARVAVRRYDWSNVAVRIVRVYETAVEGSP
jgi:phosphatidylinositol alpha-mannosyltransferase